MEIGSFAFLSLFAGLRATYDDHLRLIGKGAVDFLLVFSELFLLGVMAEVLLANMGPKSAISLQRGRLIQNFSQKWSPPPAILLLRKLG